MTAESVKVDSNNGSIASARDANLTDLGNTGGFRFTNQMPGTSTRPQELAIETLERQLIYKDSKINQLEEDIRSLRREYDTIKERIASITLITSISLVRVGIENISPHEYMLCSSEYLLAKRAEFFDFMRSRGKVM